MNVHKFIPAFQKFLVMSSTLTTALADMTHCNEQLIYAMKWLVLKVLCQVFSFSTYFLVYLYSLKTYQHIVIVLKQFEPYEISGKDSRAHKNL